MLLIGILWHLFIIHPKMYMIQSHKILLITTWWRCIEKKLLPAKKFHFYNFSLAACIFFLIQLCIPFHLLNFRNDCLNLYFIIFFAFTRWETHKISGGLSNKKFQFAKYLSLKENVYLGLMNRYQISTSSLWKKPRHYKLNKFR